MGELEELAFKLEEAGAGAAGAEWERLGQRLEQLAAEGGPARPRAAFLHARWLSAGGHGSAEQALARAAKLDPGNVQAWIMLSELLWGKGELELAHDCFRTALEQGEHPALLRGLSMLLRKLDGAPEERSERAAESLDLAKRAVALDLDDAESWYVLGNTYMSNFFSASHERKDLDSALKAYRRSESVAERGAANPDLYYNRAQVLGFLEEFQAAADDYERAGALDPALPTDQRIGELKRKVHAAAELVDRKGRLKPKRLATLRAALGPDASSDVRLKGPSAKRKLRHLVSIAELEPGENQGARLDIKVLMPLTKSGAPPVSFLAIDRAGNAFGVSVYNLDADVTARVRGDRDRVTILDPLVRQVSFDGCAFTLAQLRSPVQFVVNGEPLPASFAPPELSSSHLS